jgi:hypothetical protein
VVKHVGDILITKRIIEGNSCDTEEQTSHIGESPLDSILGKDAQQFHSFSFWDVEHVLLNNPTAKVMGPG